VGAEREADDAGWRIHPDAEPVFEVCRGRPWPGWNMIELEGTGQRQGGVARFTFEGRERTVTADLPLIAGRVSKRLVFVPFGTRRVQLRLTHAASRIRLGRLCFAWLTPWFARSRLSRRLARHHEMYWDLDQAAVWRRLRERAQELRRPIWALAWEAYELTFRQLSAVHDYTLWVNQLEPIRRERVPAARAGTHSPVATSEAAAPAGSSAAPRVSLLLPVPAGTGEAVAASLASVQAQTAPDWQACLALDPALAPAERARLHVRAGIDSRLRLIEGEGPTFGALAQEALAAAEGVFVLVLHPGDRLDREALARIARAVAAYPGAELLYSDEDHLDAAGHRCAPLFKPAWNPDLLLATPYVAGLVAYRRARLTALGGLEAAEPTWGKAELDHDAVLRYWARTPAHRAAARAIHLPLVLYHRAADPDRPRIPQAHTLVQRHLAAAAPRAEALPGQLPGAAHTRWPLPEPAPLVSLIIPTRDGHDVLQPCVDAILARTAYTPLEVLILDNQSRCPRTLAYLEAVAGRDERVRVLSWDRPFNFSAMNNWAVTQAHGDIVGLVNNDIEPVDGAWLDEMVRHACREAIGCVGARLLYPDETVQHGGVILGLGGVAGHAHRFFHRDEPGSMGRLGVTQNLSAVTAACLLVRKAVYEAVGGMNEPDLPVAYNDVDLCLKVREAGYRNLWTPHAELYHHESVSRGEDRTPKEKARAQRERHYMRERWGELLDRDPAYNPNLTLSYEDFSLR